MTLLILALAGCTDRTPGTPAAVHPPGPTTSAESTNTTESTKTTTEDIKACSLLSTADLGRLGVTGEAKPGASKGVTSCEWRVSNAQSGDGYTIGLHVYGNRSLKDAVSANPKTSVRVGGHDGLQYVADGGTGCAVAIGVGAASRVDVFVSGAGEAALCRPALDVARLVEPRLP
ncbi:DUF3558 domain-containing protein [Actinokineospora inagensis]|uniref:DUF3558 domain-containing protein n=1 Tax=Actinokineospora inagensis TaxID=103730 RepID=UPI00040323EF|nr:DUF3558 domain-containing protein [Actinokineospora inagensis]